MFNKNVKNKPGWYNAECKALRNSLNRASKNLAKNKFDRNSQNEYFAAKKKFSSYCKKCESSARKSLTKQLFAIEKSNPTEFWSLVKKMRTWGKNTASQADSIAPNEWFAHFSKLFNPISDIASLDTLNDDSVHFSELDFAMSSSEIDKAFIKLNKESSPGPDKLISRLLLAAKDKLLEPIKIIFNSIFNSKSYPSAWSYRYLVSVFKKGDLWDPDNYRGIALGSNLAKLYGLVLLNRLELRLDSGEKKVSPNQAGFRKGYRTSDHIFVLTTIVTKIVKVDKN